MAKVIVNNLNIRPEPSVNNESLGKYNKGEFIRTGDKLIANEGRIWLRYTEKGKINYICAYDKDGTKFIEVPNNISGPRADQPKKKATIDSGTGISGIPKQSHFSDERIKKWGSCFLCICVKGGLTTGEECINCLNWGIDNGKLSDKCCFKCEKEELAKEVANNYGTKFHEDYTFENNEHSFWLNQNSIEIFNPNGIGYRGN